MVKLKPLILSLLASLGAGALAGLFARNAPEVYSRLLLPPGSPPAAVFPIVWAVLYILMGVAAYLIAASDSPQKGAALRLYAEQLLLNILWPLLFFRLGWFLPALILLLALWLMAALTAAEFYRIRKAAGWLLLPYLLWLTYAAYLNLGTYLLNR